ALALRRRPPERVNKTSRYPHTGQQFDVRLTLCVALIVSSQVTEPHVHSRLRNAVGGSSFTMSRRHGTYLSVRSSWTVNIRLLSMAVVLVCLAIAVGTHAPGFAVDPNTSTTNAASSELQPERY